MVNEVMDPEVFLAFRARSVQSWPHIHEKGVTMRRSRSVSAAPVFWRMEWRAGAIQRRRRALRRAAGSLV